MDGGGGEVAAKGGGGGEVAATGGGGGEAAGTWSCCWGRPVGPSASVMALHNHDGTKVEVVDIGGRCRKDACQSTSRRKKAPRSFLRLNK